MKIEHPCRNCKEEHCDEITCWDLEFFNEHWLDDDDEEDWIDAEEYYEDLEED